jgi:hypothetical protein
MTKSDERRRQRDIGGALLIGALALAVLLGLMVFTGLP